MEKRFKYFSKRQGITNSLHWTLDVSFKEDKSRFRQEAAPENYAICLHIALNIIRTKHFKRC